ncbi:hypothetical protein HMPREF0277_0435 [Corynebacterium accolens ATCC 49726]|nr:hypothetical protein HMPREF0277_0435 [Corynebacterium accolens ATCC 49726]
MMDIMSTAGVQFSLPLIDFARLRVLNEVGWGSVLITPDRLLRAIDLNRGKLGFSSHYP